MDGDAFFEKCHYADCTHAVVPCMRWPSADSCSPSSVWGKCASCCSSLSAWLQLSTTQSETSPHHRHHHDHQAWGVAKCGGGVKICAWPHVKGSIGAATSHPVYKRFSVVRHGVRVCYKTLLSVSVAHVTKNEWRGRDAKYRTEFR